MHARGQVQADALKILGWIRAVKKQEFSRRDAQRALQSAFPKADDLDAPLAELVTRGYVAEEFGHRRDSRRYAVNPLALREPPLDTRDSRDTCPPTPPPPPPAGDPSDGHDTRDTPAGEEVIEV
jgi:hypothetical protein